MNGFGAWRQWLGSVFFLILSTDSLAEVYYSKDEAFELAFGSGASVEAVSLFLTDEQAANIERTAKVKLDSRLYTFHRGMRGGQVLGYAAIESHTVRTQPEVVMIVLDNAGQLVRIEVLAFHEPPEYKPPTRWFERLYRRPVQDLVIDHGVDAIAGATLSSRAALDGARKVLAIFKLAYKEESN